MLLAIDEGTFEFGAIGIESNALALLQAFFEVTDVGASVSICVSALSLRQAVHVISSVAVSMCPVVLALSYFQAVEVQTLETTLVRI